MSRIAYAFDASDAIRAMNLATNALQTGAPAVLRRGYERAGEIKLQADLARFDRGGDGWRKLAPSTVARKGHSTILVESGGLRKSLIRGNPHNVFRSSPNSIEVGSNHPLLRFHQYGTGHVPQRRVIVPPSPETFRRMVAAVEAATLQMLQPFFGNRFAGIGLSSANFRGGGGSGPSNYGPSISLN